MKRTHITALVVMAISAGIFLTVMGNTSTYADFGTAFNHPQQTYHVVGDWEKSVDVEYDPLKNPNYFAFSLRDDKGEVRRVEYYSNRPTDFEKSEKIVIVGKALDNGAFHAEQILMKCPSKYEEEGVKVKAEAHQR